MADRGVRLELASIVPGFGRPGVALVAEPDRVLVKVQLFAGESETALADALDCALPSPRTMVTAGDVDVAWLAPGEWLVSGRQVDLIEGALAQQVALVTDLTHALAAYRIAGEGAEDALAAHCPLDLDRAAFPVGAAARSLIGDAGLFVARLADAQDASVFRLIVDQTMAAYLVRMLSR